LRELIGLRCLRIVISVCVEILMAGTLTINGQTVLLHPIIGLFLLLSGLMLDENHVADPLHIRRNGFAESKGQSSVVVAC
jgi:hypothetical protein